MRQNTPSAILNFAGESVTTADAGACLSAVKRGDEWMININDAEHYVSPDAVIVGG